MARHGGSRSARRGGVALAVLLAWAAPARAVPPPIDWTREEAEEAAGARRATHLLLGLTGLGAGAVAAGLGALFGAQTLETRRQLELVPMTDLSGRLHLIGVGEGQRLLANVLFAVAAALGVAGVLVWVF